MSKRIGGGNVDKHAGKKDMGLEGILGSPQKAHATEIKRIKDVSSQCRDRGSHTPRNDCHRGNHPTR